MTKILEIIRLIFDVLRIFELTNCIEKRRDERQNRAASATKRRQHRAARATGENSKILLTQRRFGNKNDRDRSAENSMLQMARAF